MNERTTRTRARTHPRTHARILWRWQKVHGNLQRRHLRLAQPGRFPGRCHHGRSSGTNIRYSFIHLTSITSHPTDRHCDGWMDVGQRAHVHTHARAHARARSRWRKCALVICVLFTYFSWPRSFIHSFIHSWERIISTTELVVVVVVVVVVQTRMTVERDCFTLSDKYMHTVLAHHAPPEQVLLSCFFSLLSFSLPFYSARSRRVGGRAVPRFSLLWITIPISLSHAHYYYRW